MIVQPAHLRIFSGAFLAAIVITTAAAQETQTSRPWKSMQGSNAGSVGSCPDVDGGEGDTCYIVRCRPKFDLAFVIQHPGIADDNVRSVRIKIGRYKEIIRLEDNAANERVASLSTYPHLLAALISGQKWADLETVESDFQYTTEFELTGARTAIGRVRKSCRS